MLEVAVAGVRYLERHGLRAWEAAMLRLEGHLRERGPETAVTMIGFVM